jgi:hypothetical protein
MANEQKVPRIPSPPKGKIEHDFTQGRTRLSAKEITRDGTTCYILFSQTTMHPEVALMRSASWEEIYKYGRMVAERLIKSHA